MVMSVWRRYVGKHWRTGLWKLEGAGHKRSLSSKINNRLLDSVEMPFFFSIF